MVGIIYTIVALSKQGVALKNIGNTVIVGMVKLCQKQGVALKNIGNTVIVGMVLLFKCIWSKMAQGARIELDYMKSVLIKI